MKESRLSSQYLLWMIILSGGVLAFLLWPFLTAFIVAAATAALFYGAYERLLRLTGNRRSLSASLVSLVVFLLIVLPLLLVGTLVVVELQKTYQHTLAQPGALEAFLHRAETTIASLPLIGDAFAGEGFSQEKIVENLQKGSSVALALLQRFYTSFAQTVFWLLVFFFSLFYLLIDGKRLMRYLMEISPLPNRQENVLIERFLHLSRATMKGTFIVGTIQGILGGLLFAIVGIPSPLTWGVVMIILSIIPVLGSGIVWFPVALVMLASGHLWEGVTILAFGFLVISTIDNILRPKIVGKDAQMHPLLVFFTTLGGIFVFGLPGFIVGPLVAALFLTLLEIYAGEYKGELSRLNAQ